MGARPVEVNGQQLGTSLPLGEGGTGSEVEISSPLRRKASVGRIVDDWLPEAAVSIPFALEDVSKNRPILHPHDLLGEVRVEAPAKNRQVGQNLAVGSGQPGQLGFRGRLHIAREQIGIPGGGGQAFEEKRVPSRALDEISGDVALQWVVPSQLGEQRPRGARRQRLEVDPGGIEIVVGNPARLPPTPGRDHEPRQVGSAGEHVRKEIRRGRIDPVGVLQTNNNRLAGQPDRKLGNGPLGPLSIERGGELFHRRGGCHFGLGYLGDQRQQRLEIRG